MKKADLRSGMILLNSTGEYGLLVETEIILARGGSTSTHFIDEDLQGIQYKNYTIIEVLELRAPENSNIGGNFKGIISGTTSEDFRVSIWRRPVMTTKLTVAEISEKLGYIVEVVA